MNYETRDTVLLKAANKAMQRSSLRQLGDIYRCTATGAHKISRLPSVRSDSPFSLMQRPRSGSTVLQQSVAIS